jgi:ABC-type Fe3+ transport system substrate-binding protein
VQEFLRYILSAEGQQAVTDDQGYLPLSPRLAAEQLHQLE